MVLTYQNYMALISLEVNLKTDCKQCEHYGDGCYCPTDKYCTAFTKKKVYVRHTYEFKTEEDWQPMTPTCLVDCPFNFMIGFGNSCKYLNEKDVDCPFVGNCVR